MLRFNRQCVADCGRSAARPDAGQYVDSRGFSRRLIRDHLLPMGAESGRRRLIGCWLTIPGETAKSRTLETDAAGPVLAATFQGRREPLTSPHLIAAFLVLPLVTLKVVGGIYYEAARLWLKGARIIPRPQHVSDPSDIVRGCPVAENSE